MSPVLWHQARGLPLASRLQLRALHAAAKLVSCPARAAEGGRHSRSHPSPLPVRLRCQGVVPGATHVLTGGMREKESVNKRAAEYAPLNQP